MLTRVYVDNYKCFSNFEWRPGKLVLLAGRNGSGKSTLMDLVTDIGAVVADRDAVADVFPETSLNRWERRTEQRVELDVTTAAGTYRYVLRVDHAWKRGRVRVAEERLTLGEQPLFHFVDGEMQLYRDNGSVGPRVPGDWSDARLKTVPARDDNTKLSAFREAVGRYWFVAPEPRRIEEAARSETHALRSTLENFVAWYRFCAGDAIQVAALMKRLQAIFKDFLGLRLETTGRDERLLQAVFQLPGAEGRRGETVTFDFGELSDGQRLLVALYTLLEFGPVRDGLLCLDEPDNYLALEEIEPWLAELEVAVKEGDGQVFLVSHNAEVINRLWPEHGVWFERDGLGPVRVRALNDADGALTPAEVMARGWG